MNYLKFWGTRGSCPVSGPQYQEFGGNTPCLELKYDDVNIVFDAGTGIRPLGEEFVRDKVTKIDLFFSHMHWDHLQGFPFFIPIYQKGTEIKLWTPQGVAGRDVFEKVFDKEFFPMKLSQLNAKLDFKSFSEMSPVKIGPITLSFHPVNHPCIAYCFKIETPHQTIGYVSDNELKETSTPLVDFFRGVDLLIHEAQYFPEEYEKKKGWGHSNCLATHQFFEQTGAHKRFITHHDPSHTDADLKRLEKLCSIEHIRDGQVIQLGRVVS